MEGSIFPNGVLIDQVALKRVEDTKSAQIMKNRTSLSSGGVISGGVVSVNPINTDRVDVAAFTGFTPRGDYIVSTVNTSNVSLSDYVAGVINVICAVYTEDKTYNQPHESDGNTYPTYSKASYRIRVFSETDFENPLVIPPSDDNLDNDALDRCLILAKVEAEGVGVTLTNIELPTNYNSILYANPNQLVSIVGVTILSVDPSVDPGQAEVEFDNTASPDLKIKWKAPGSTYPASYTTFTSDSLLTLTDGSGKWVKIQAIVSQLPTVSGVYNENFEIVNLYYQSIPRLSAEDYLHRNKVGTGIITEHNAHGLSLDDLAGETISLLDEHQDVEHCNGIWRESNPSVFDVVINTIAPNGDTLLIQTPTVSDLYYVNGKKSNTASPGSFYFTPANFSSGFLGPTNSDGAKLYDLYVDDESILTVKLRAEYPYPSGSGARTITGTWIVDSSEEHPSGSFVLECEVAAFSLRFTWNSGVPVFISKTSPPSDPEGQIIRLYSSDNINWIDLYVNRTGASLPDAILPTVSGVYTDTITVYDRPDMTQNLHLRAIVYWWNSVRGTLGWNTDISDPSGGVRHTIDKKVFGTLCTGNINDNALEDLEYGHIKDLHKSGILFNKEGGKEFKLSSTGLTATILGGNYYCRGRKLSKETTAIALPASSQLLIYVDYLGNLQYLEIGTEFSSYQKAISYLVGSTFVGDPLLDSDYVNDKSWFVEKGVPLWYVVTDLTNITLSLDVSRNVSNNVYEWSVGGRRGSFEDTSTLAAFDNLEAAFSWSSALNLQYGADDNNRLFVLVGDSSVISGRPISQSAYSTVVGSDLARVALAGSGITEGMWVLGTNCEVRDVKISASSLDSSVVFRLDTGCRIIGCDFSGSMNSNYFCGPRSNSYYVSNIVIDGNILDEGNACLITNSSHSSNSNWAVKNNYVKQTIDASSSRSIIALNGTNHTISNNILHTYSVAASTINCFSSSGLIGSNVTDNYFYLGREATACNNYGIYLSGTCEDLRINCNYFSVKDLVTAGKEIGIRAFNLNKVEIKNNFFNILFRAITMSGKINYLDICGNYIYGGYNNKTGADIEFGSFSSAYGSGVITVVSEVLQPLSDSFYDINIVNNKIQGYSYTTTGGIINFYVLYTTIPFVSGSNLNISNNSIDSIICKSVNGSTYAISANVSAGPISANISNNSITNFVVEGSTNSSIYGILAAGGSDDSLVNILNNIVSITAPVSAPISASSYGISSSNLKFCAIKNNSISVYDGGVTNSYTIGIRNNGSESCDITNNSTEDSKIGISSRSNNSCSIVGNKITALSCGIELNAANNNSVIGNDVKVYELFDISSGTVGSAGIYVLNCIDLVINNCNVLLTDSGSIGDMNSCIYVSSNCKGFSISNCSLLMDSESLASIGIDNSNIIVGEDCLYFSINNCVCRLGFNNATGLGHQVRNITIRSGCQHFTINGCDLVLGGDSVANISYTCACLWVNHLNTAPVGNYKVCGCTTKIVFSGTVDSNCYQAIFDYPDGVCSISNNTFDNTKAGGVFASGINGVKINGWVVSNYRVMFDSNVIHGSNDDSGVVAELEIVNGLDPAPPAKPTRLITCTNNFISLNPVGGVSVGRFPKIIKTSGTTANSNYMDEYLITSGSYVLNTF